ncbi:isocitrate lyase/PEP mutase family protein [Ensifer adhaerens]|uniref:isocitrate lyase/PEP mutase family protein n=1 Tax=Ensifer adhaerens TaxID=106592 RepID=UPI0020302B2D|nr:oxaloacetate decarboxylase [Ensifer adhaerens]
MDARSRYRELLKSPTILVSAGVYDAFSARLAERAGFQAVSAGGNSGIGGLLAAPDLGQTNMRDMADLYARICAAVDVPVMVDADTGYGGVHNLRQAVRAFERAGVAGFTLNDQSFPNRCGYLEGKSLVPVSEMLAKIKAAVDARSDSNMTIVARTDAANVAGLDAALERCALFLEAGADVAKPQCVDDEPSIRKVVSELQCPYIANLSNAAGRFRLDIPDLQRLGAAAVTLPTLSLFSAMMGMTSILSQVSSTGSVAGLADRLPSLDNYYAAVGLSEYAEREESYRAFAEHILARR